MLNITEDQVQQMLTDTRLDKATLLSLAEIFSAPREEGAGQKRSLAAGGKKSSIFATLPRKMGGTMKPRKTPEAADAADMEMPLPQFAKLLEDANIAQGSAAMSMAILFDTDKSGTISLREFVTSMALLLRGEPEDKLAFIFSTYDLDDGGTLTMDVRNQLILYLTPYIYF